MLIYAKNRETLARFYEELLGLRVLAADAEHRVAANDDIRFTPCPLTWQPKSPSAHRPNRGRSRP